MKCKILYLRSLFILGILCVFASPSFADGTLLIPAYENVLSAPNVLAPRLPSSAPAAWTYWTLTPTNRLIGRWDMEGVAWTNDTSGSNYTLRISNTVAQLVAGTNSQLRQENCANFTGTTAGMFTPSAILDGYSNAAYLCNYYCKVTNAAHIGIMVAQEGTDNSFALCHDAGGDVFRIFARESDHSFHSYTNTQKIPTNIWIALAATFSATDKLLCLYTNGVRAGAVALDGLPLHAATPVAVGSSTADINRGCMGRLDGVLIYAGNPSNSIPSSNQIFVISQSNAVPENLTAR